MIMHDAATPITERIEYATEVQVALDFSETRRSLRAQPRQSYSYTLLERTRGAGVNYWRARETQNFSVPWLPSAVCRGAPVPAELRAEYQVGSTVYLIAKNEVGTGSISNYTATGVPTISAPVGFPSGGFIAPSVEGRVSVSDTAYTGAAIRGATIEVFRNSPTPIGTPMDWNTFSPDGATDITESVAYRMAQLDFTGSTLGFRDFYSERPRLTHLYTYVMNGYKNLSEYRSFFMGRKGRLLPLIDEPRSYVPLKYTYPNALNEWTVYHVREPAHFWWVDDSDSFNSVSSIAPGVWKAIYPPIHPEGACIEEVWLNRRIDQDTLEITHIAPGVATSSLVITDL